MATLTKYGNFIGSVPNTGGRVFWVAPSDSYVVEGKYYPASDYNDGLSPRKALRRVNRAWSLVSANAGDVIVLLPGTHSAADINGTAASIAASTAGVTMTGLNCGPGSGNFMRKRTALTCVAADETVNVTAADIEIANITFLGDALNVGSYHVNTTVAGHRLHVHDCTFDVTAQTANTGIGAVAATGAATNVTIQRCVFHVDGAFGPMLDMSATLDSVVQDCLFSLSTGTIANFILTGAAARLFIRRNTFNAGAGTATAPIDGTGATVANGILIAQNIFGVNSTVSIDNFDAAEAVLSMNYIATVGGGAGGTLLTAIT
jgi:hypothetical protein